jgi:hypothetical protein
MDDDGPILVRAAVEDETHEDCSIDIPSNSPQPLTVPFTEDILEAITQNTTDLQNRLNKFINGLNSKIQSVPSLTENIRPGYA